MRHPLREPATGRLRRTATPRRFAHTYDTGIAAGARATRACGQPRIRGTIMADSKLHKRKLAAALKRMGTSLATHTESTFKPAGMASKTLDEFKARRAAEKLGLLPKPKAKVVERYEIDVDTAQVTKLPLRMKTR
jgi:hypothetical protein